MGKAELQWQGSRLDLLTLTFAITSTFFLYTVAMLIASTDSWLLSSVSTPCFVFICCLESYRTMIVRWCGCGVTRFAELGWLKRREKHRSRSEVVWRQWRYHGCWALSSVLQCSVLSASVLSSGGQFKLRSGAAVVRMVPLTPRHTGREQQSPAATWLQYSLSPAQPSVAQLLGN